MIKPEHVPDEAVKAVMHCFHTRNAAKSAIAAAINAWPGWEGSWDETHGLRRVIILPLPQETRDE